MEHGADCATDYRVPSNDYNRKQGSIIHFHKHDYFRHPVNSIPYYQLCCAIFGRVDEDLHNPEHESSHQDNSRQYGHTLTELFQRLVAKLNGCGRGLVVTEHDDPVDHALQHSPLL